MFYHIKRSIEKARKYLFDKELRKILDLPPLVIGEGQCTALSMVHHRDVLPYLLALRSFARFVPLKAVVVVADPTITEVDRHILAKHVPGIRIEDASTHRIEGLPVGGCWERLTALIRESDSDYVIQLDADTVTLAEPKHVKDAIATDRSFTLGTYDLQARIEIAELSRWAKTHCKGKVHIQLLCESKVFEVYHNEQKYYIRGCAGFTGIAKGKVSKSEYVDFSQRMRDAVGPRWSDWGTEQFASNFIIANTLNPSVLPHPVYCSPDRIDESTVFIHFIGHLRFTSDLYRRTASQVLGQLANTNRGGT